jgi:hypothetical protein
VEKRESKHETIRIDASLERQDEVEKGSPE